MANSAERRASITTPPKTASFKPFATRAATSSLFCPSCKIRSHLHRIVAEIKKSEIKDELKYAQSALEEHPLVNKAQPLTDDRQSICLLFIHA